MGASEVHRCSAAGVKAWRQQAQWHLGA